MYDVIMIIWYYGVSATEAYKILDSLTDEEKETIWKEYVNYQRGRDWEDIEDE